MSEAACLTAVVPFGSPFGSPPWWVVAAQPVLLGLLVIGLPATIGWTIRRLVERGTVPGWVRPATALGLVAALLILIATVWMLDVRQSAAANDAPAADSSAAHDRT